MKRLSKNNKAKLLTMPLPEDQPARRAAEAKRKRQVTRNEKLYQRRVKDWNQYLESTTFIGAFLNRVELVSQRLPLTPEWQVFPDEIRRLEPGIVQLGSWQKKPPNRDLETLEIRLKEMLDLATGSANEAGSRVPWAVPRGVLSPTRGSITPGQIKATSAPIRPLIILTKGNLALLRGTDGGLKGAVNLAVAARFGGVSRHAIELAAKRGELAYRESASGDEYWYLSPRLLPVRRIIRSYAKQCEASRKQASGPRDWPVF